MVTSPADELSSTFWWPTIVTEAPVEVIVTFSAAETFTNCSKDSSVTPDPPVICSWPVETATTSPPVAFITTPAIPTTSTIAFASSLSCAAAEILTSACVDRTDTPWSPNTRASPAVD